MCSMEYFFKFTCNWSSHCNKQDLFSDEAAGEISKWISEETSYRITEGISEHISS